jgi:Holliday junction DNA helicase RuvA
MIGRLTGVLLEKRPPQLLLEVGGVAYEIEAPMSTFYALPEVGQNLSLHTHLHVREDAHLLFGFASEAERSLFRTLIKVNGVGAKVALAILSGISVENFAHSIMGADINALTRVPGIGKKTAARLVVEMRDKLDGLPLGTASGTSGGGSGGAFGDAASQAVEALIALGYKPVDAAKMVKSAALVAETTEQIIRVALQSTHRS